MKEKLKQFIECCKIEGVPEKIINGLCSKYTGTALIMKLFKYYDLYREQNDKLYYESLPEIDEKEMEELENACNSIAEAFRNA